MPDPGVSNVLRTIPWLLPGALVATVVGFTVAWPLASWARISTLAAFLLTIGIGLIAAATLTPGVDVIATGCDVSRLRPPALRDLRTLNETSLNLALFLPLGLGVGLLPSRLLPRAAIAALVLPVAVELVQAALPVLERRCQSADVIDNALGCAAGIAAAIAARSAGRLAGQFRLLVGP